MNARNLKYIKTKNSKESISLADSKLKTKHFLSSRGIPFAETYITLSTQQELQDFSLDTLGVDAFVIKPNKWSQWKGILIVRKEDDVYMIDGKSWTEDELKLHMTDILHGSYSLHGSSDTVVIEELLTPSVEFSHFCQYGLADIRIIVYNYVPITAMIRMPTQYSGGKANLAQGGIWLGLGIANGQVISLSQNKTSYTKSFPTEFKHLSGKNLPYWDDILLYSSQVQAYTKLGYLALDWVITRNWPKLLEINARAGLEIQNVNLVPLASRLAQVETLRIHSPEKGVEIAKTLFHAKTIADTFGKKVIYLEEPWQVDGMDVTVSVDMSRTTPLVSIDSVYTLEGQPLEVKTSSGVVLRLSTYEVSPETKNTIILWTDDIKNLLINPTKKLIPHTIATDTRWPRAIYELDDMVYRLSRKVNLSSLLKPDNYFMALDAYIADPHGYNPVFAYRFPDDRKIQSLREAAQPIREKIVQLESGNIGLARLYSEKLDEIGEKISLVEAYREEDYPSIKKYNDALFGMTQDHLLYDAREKVLSMHGSGKKAERLLWKVLSLDEVMDTIGEYFDSHNIPKIPISLESSNLSRMSVAYGKEVKIRLSKNAVFREKEMQATLSHEIGTHLLRYLNGKSLWLKLFQFGTGYYLGDEEGFAIYRSLGHLPDGYEKNAMYIKYYLLSAADTLSFAETSDLIRSLYPNKSLESIFSDTVRLKRGISRTEVRGVEGTTYQKDKIYLDGYTRVSSWITSGGNPDKLLFWKIKIADLDIVEFL